MSMLLSKLLYAEATHKADVAIVHFFRAMLLKG
jgi:hypothetical protein